MNPSGMEPSLPFSDQEKRFFLAGVLMTSQVSLDALLHFLKESKISISAAQVTPIIPIEETGPEFERRSVVIEAIKTSNLPIDCLLEFIIEVKAQPDWARVAIPHGRMILECLLEHIVLLSEKLHSEKLHIAHEDELVSYLLNQGSAIEWSRASDLPLRRPRQIKPLRQRTRAFSREEWTSKYLNASEPEEYEQILPETSQQISMPVSRRSSDVSEGYWPQLLQLRGLVYERRHLFRRIFNTNYEAVFRPSKTACTIIGRLFRPAPKNGYRRLEWQCECGSWLYGDFDNANPGQVDELYRELTDVLMFDQPFEHSPGVKTESSSAQSPPSVSSTSASSRTMTHVSGSSSGSSSTSSSSDELYNRISSFSSQNEIAQPPIKKYFAICANSGENLVKLGEVDVSTTTLDSEFFRKIWQEYKRLRGHRMHGMRNYLIKPVDVKFVQFTLEENHRVDLSFSPPHIPPESEVRSGRYEYAPCPLPPIISQPIPASTFLHYCTHHAQTYTSVWTRRLPKRLRQRLLEQRMRAPALEYVPGWGVYVIEGPNWRSISWVGAVVMSGSVVVAVAWSVSRGDAGTGFTVGSFVIGVWIAWMTAFYYRWKEV